MKVWFREFVDGKEWLEGDLWITGSGEMHFTWVMHGNYSKEMFSIRHVETREDSKDKCFVFGGFQKEETGLFSWKSIQCRMTKQRLPKGA